MTREPNRKVPPQRRSDEVRPHGRRQINPNITVAERERLRQQHQQAQRERKRAAAAAVVTLSGMLSNPRISLYDVLMVEFCMQEENRDTPGAMKAAYLKQLHAARGKQGVPRQRTGRSSRFAANTRRMAMRAACGSRWRATSSSSTLQQATLAHARLLPSSASSWKSKGLCRAVRTAQQTRQDTGAEGQPGLHP